MHAEAPRPDAHASDARRATVLQPCDVACAYAESPRADDSPADWIWCGHPAAPHRLIRAGRDCPRYTPNWPVGG